MQVEQEERKSVPKSYGVFADKAEVAEKYCKDNNISKLGRYVKLGMTAWSSPSPNRGAIVKLDLWDTKTGSMISAQLTNVSPALLEAWIKFDLRVELCDLALIFKQTFGWEGRLSDEKPCLVGKPVKIAGVSSHVVLAPWEAVPIGRVPVYASKFLREESRNKFTDLHFINFTLRVYANQEEKVSPGSFVYDTIYVFRGLRLVKDTPNVYQPGGYFVVQSDPQVYLQWTGVTKKAIDEVLEKWVSTATDQGDASATEPDRKRARVEKIIGDDECLE